MNRINQLFQDKPSNICSVFITAGYPELKSTVEKVLELEQSGADMIELGIPFSDPLADGETIQETSSVALENGMNLSILFDQVSEIRAQSEIPIVLMGYLNPILKFGLEDFLTECEKKGVDGLIIPDISLEEYELNYQEVMTTYNVPLTFLVTPKTSTDRLRRIVGHTKSFIYYVSSASTTGKTQGYSEEQVQAFKAYQALQIHQPTLMGFGIHDKETFDTACKFFNGGIIGSAYLRSIKSGVSSERFLLDILE